MLTTTQVHNTSIFQTRLYYWDLGIGANLETQQLIGDWWLELERNNEQGHLEFQIVKGSSNRKCVGSLKRQPLFEYNSKDDIIPPITVTEHHIKKYVLS